MGQHHLSGGVFTLLEGRVEVKLFGLHIDGALGKMCSVKSGVPSIVNVDTLDNKSY